MDVVVLGGIKKDGANCLKGLKGLEDWITHTEFIWLYNLTKGGSLAGLAWVKHGPKGKSQVMEAPLLH